MLRCILFSMIWLCIACGEKNLKTLVIPDENWSLWLDTLAEWRNDRVFLPGNVDWANIPVNLPSGGWNTLHDTNAVVVDLPATVEGAVCVSDTIDCCVRKEYRDKESGLYFTQVFYSGVSWWGKSFHIPKSFTADSVVLQLQTLGMRTEVFVDKYLVGYHCGHPVVLNCDVSDIIAPGERHNIAVRITSDAISGEYWKGYTIWGNTKQKVHGYTGGAGIAAGTVLTAY